MSTRSAGSAAHAFRARLGAVASIAGGLLALITLIVGASEGFAQTPGTAAPPAAARQEPPSAPASGNTPQAPAAPAPIRVAVIGASASAGFGCVLRETRDDGGYANSFRLIEMVRLACPELDILTSDMSSGFFFMAPVRNGARAAARALQFAPDCVIAIDFLFWYGYGDDDAEGRPLDDESDRLAKFERGLAELARFDMPVLVGDMPDMSPAVGKMLSRRQMPAAETLAKLNARLAEWALARPNVRVVPLARMQRQLMEDRALEIDGVRLVSTPERPLLQKDELHPAPMGMAGLACAVASELKDALSMRATEAAQKAAETIKSEDGCTPEPHSTFERARGELKPSRRGDHAQDPARPGASGAASTPPAGAR